MSGHRDVGVPAEKSSRILSRRKILQQTAWLVAAAPFARGTGMAEQPVSPVMDKLSMYMSVARNRTLPDEVVEKAKHHILDTFAAMVSGSDLSPGRAAIRFAREYGGERVSTVVASPVLCGAIEAAITNAELAHSDETDDYYAYAWLGAHPGCSIVPAALALGEQSGIDGMEFLRAVVLGYDVGIRVVSALGPEALIKETHNMVATFGSAAAGGSAADLNAQQMRWLLDYAAQQSGSGIFAWRRDTEHMEKAFVFAGAGARNGVTAALLVKAGWTGVNDILSGPDNFFQAYSPKADPAGLIDKLGERYEVTRTNIKKWTVGGPIQAALDALDNLLKRHPFEADQVQQVVVRVYTSGAATVNGREMPDICLQHMIAVMLMDKTVSFRAAHDRDRMQDPLILRQRAKVQLVPDEELERQMPRREAIVEVTLADGTHLTDHVEAVRGTTENPMTRDEVVAKARDLMTPVLGPTNCTKLIAKLLGLDDAKDIRELRPLLQRA
ncbi:MAG TPA: MmgE/PrpD family protein [Planctomycetaceae bacterium]|nr:MmgE/PrpD family protein [Planctomycetaceae bacterium]